MKTSENNVHTVILFWNITQRTIYVGGNACNASMCFQFGTWQTFVS